MYVLSGTGPCIFCHVRCIQVWNTTLQWRHNERNGVSNHRCLDCYSTVCSGANERKHQSSTSMAFARGIHRWPAVDYPQKGPVAQKMLPFDDVIIRLVLCMLWLQSNLFMSSMVTSLALGLSHYSDVILGTMASPITSITTVYSTVHSYADQRKHLSSASLAFVRGIHRRPVNSPHKWPVTQKMFPFDDVIMAALTNMAAKQPWRIWTIS